MESFLAEHGAFFMWGLGLAISLGLSIFAVTAKALISTLKDFLMDALNEIKESIASFGQDLREIHKELAEEIGNLNGRVSMLEGEHRAYHGGGAR